MSTLKHVDMYKNDKTVRRYSESFKKTRNRTLLHKKLQPMRKYLDNF